MTAPVARRSAARPEPPPRPPLLAVQVIYELRGRLVANPADVVDYSIGATLLRFPPRKTFAGMKNALASIMTIVGEEGHAVLVKALDAPGRITDDGGREVRFAFLARDTATESFLDAIRELVAGAEAAAAAAAAALADAAVALHDTAAVADLDGGPGPEPSSPA